MSISIATLALDVLEQQLSQQLRPSHYALPLSARPPCNSTHACRANASSRYRIVHLLHQQRRPRFAVRPVNRCLNP